MRIMDNGTGFGLNYSSSRATKARFYYMEKKESAACFWVAACQAFGDFYAITY
jgi:hypothetical protein